MIRDNIESKPIGLLSSHEDQVEHVATEKELAAVAKWRRERDERHRRYGYWADWGDPKIPKWERLYQGRLMVRLEDVRLKTERYRWGETMQRSFAESRVRKLEPAIPRILATIAAMAAAKTSNAAFDERERIAAAEEAKRRADAERRRKHEQSAAALLDELMELQSRADRLRALLVALRRTESGGRVGRLLEWTEGRLEGLEQSLGGSALEQRLEKAGLFDAEDEAGTR
ncbi:hypothetical protein GCM10022276_12390 [Sphingomonas limnosediminicola]|uniref:Uncharacterized protein n=1 Tax=Sphingomonas limnosediminicola TaxID=940133 RepID=A0ABP7L7X5_9SPHN